MQTRSIAVVFGILFLAMAVPLTAQERNRGGRTPAYSGGERRPAPQSTGGHGSNSGSDPLPRPDPAPQRPPHFPDAPPPACGEPTVIDGDPSWPPAPGAITVVFSGGLEGFNIVLSDHGSMPDYAGFDFSEARCVAYDDPEADMFLEDDGKTSYMVVGDDSEIQDLGPTSSLRQVNALQMKEWSRSHDVVLEEGRSYVVRTWEGYHAMFRVVSLVPGRVVFDWVVQRQPRVVTFTHGGIHRSPWVTRVKLSR